MLIIPAIDIKDGACVRLQQGAFNAKTIYAHDPIEIAQHFKSSGAKKLHVVDLDGAESGTSQNTDVINKMINQVALPIQLGGGIRSLNAMKFWLDAGVEKVIVGSLAAHNPEQLFEALNKYEPEQIILAVDAIGGRVAVRGWQESTSITALDMILKFKPAGLQRLLYTDILRDGMLTGPNLQATKHIAQSSGLKVIASGGVSSKQDLDDLKKLQDYGVDSVVVGKAFYERLILPEEVL
ncbi:MAG: 1-(5-phosphoribosyl)-5-[(5-phosphoribosylamino)methylideneamino]imidazole-4-carboxamide isomerase [bacterium]